MNLAFSNTLRALLVSVSMAAVANADAVVTQSGGTLKIKADQGNDEIDIDGAGALGEVNVSLNQAPATAFIGVRDIEINSGAGDDDIFIDGVQIGGSMTVKMGAGEDDFDLDNGPGLPVLIGGNLDLKLGGQETDFVELDSFDGVTIGRNLSIKGAADIDMDGNGLTSAAEVADISIGGNLRIDMNVTLDTDADGRTVDIDSINVGGTTKFNLGNDEDLIDVSRSAFVLKFEAKLGGGDDRLDFDSVDTRFASTVVLNGGDGVDTIANALDVVFAVLPTFKKFEVLP